MSQNLKNEAYREISIIVNRVNNSESKLYISAKAYDLEISNNGISAAIKFALSQYWRPEIGGSDMLLVKDSDGFSVIE